MAYDSVPRKTKAKKATKVINAVDLFCGAGGTSSGLIHAVNDLGYDIKLTAINHWDVAIATHTKNHEDVEHFCQSIDTIDPMKIVPGGRLQLLVASPECTHHSNARGGKPRSDQKRADAWLLMRWINNLYVENILIENVKEFESWGPLTAKGLPDKRYKGQYFQQFIAALRINYNVEYRVLNCANYGDPTTRERLFILARRGHKKIVWPSRTHASRKELAKMAAQPDLFTESENTALVPWVAAREIIDWSLEGKSIFGRKKALSPNTMRRIFKGLEKHGLKKFLVNLKNKDRRDRSVDEPTFTQAAGGNHQAVVEPFIVPQSTAPATRDIDEPVPTLTTTSRGVGVVEVEPFTLSVERAHTNRSIGRPVEEPVATITGSPRLGIVEGEIQPFTISAGGPELEAKGVDEPLRTVLTRDHQAIIEAFLVKFHGGENGHNRSYPVDEPISTLDTSNRFGLVEADPYLVKLKNNQNAGSVDDPLNTLTTKESYALAEPYIIKFYGSGDGVDAIDDPLATVTAKDRFALCIPSIGIALDIRFRMLQPHELAAAMSFPPDYEFTGNREAKVKQIGNAVPLKTAKALCRSLLS